MNRQLSPQQRLRPWLLCGMTALFVARPLFPSESAATHGDGLTAVMLWIALGVFWLLGAIGRPKFQVRFGWTDAAVVLLLGWYVVAGVWAVRHGTPRPALNMLWEWIGMGLSYLLARQFIATAREARAVAAVMVALAVGLSGYGLYQSAYEMPQTRAHYAADPDAALRGAGLWFPPGSPERKLFESRLENPEPMATFALTNSLAALLAPWLVVLAGVGVASVRSRKRLLAVVLCLIPVTACLLLTKSRSGYVAACMGLLLVWLVCRERKARIGWKMPAVAGWIAAVLVAAALIVEGPAVLGKAWKSFGYRVQYWQSSARMIADHPLVGCGPGNFQNAYTQYKLPEASEEVADPHNFLLDVWATAGTPAVLALLAVLGSFTWAMMAGKGGSPKLPHSNPLPKGDGTDGTDESDLNGWKYVLAGGMLGFLLSAPLGLMSAAPPGAAAVLLGLPLAAIAVALLWGWIREGRLPGLLPAVGVVVLLVALLATGGIGLPSVAGTLWLLLALGLGGRWPRVLPSYAAWSALAVGIALAVTCYTTAYSPVLNCQANLRLAERDSARAVEHLAAAAMADPLAAEPWRQLAAIEFENWWQHPNSEETILRSTQASGKALKLAPNSAAIWLASGDRAYRASFKTDQSGKRLAPHAIVYSVDAYRAAARLYPNSAVYHAKLAEAYRAAGDPSAFRQEAENALRLDDATPHLDKKLPAELRGRLSQGLNHAP
jgi:hypothetical protein